MPIDNDIYNRMADAWWREDGFLDVLRTGLNRARFGYFRDALTRTLGRKPSGLRVLDLGCGGGYLAEEFARLGCTVTGVDPSEPSLEAARRHARESGLPIDYRRGTAEAIPFPDASFDAAVCCDVLEHVPDVAAALRETARVLRPGGAYFYDTINRTLRSRFVMITLMQDWSWTALMPGEVHVWEMFIRPEELRARLEAAGIAPRAMAGLSPGANPLALLWALAERRRGRITYAEVGRRLDMRPSRDLSISYMGWGVRG